MKKQIHPAVFLDRDGTIIHDRNYLKDPRHIKFYRGVFPALRLLHRGGYKLVLVTNQSGIGRGLFSRQDLRRVHHRFQQELKGAGVRLDGIFVCPHRPEESCACRKPKLKLFLVATKRLGIDLKKSYLVGDRLSDITPARPLKSQGILVQTGLGRQQKLTSQQKRSIHRTRSLVSAARWILNRKKRGE